MKAALAVSALALAFASTAQAADVPSADKTFMKKAAEGGLLEIQASQIAVQKTQDSQVKSFADKMVTDHTKAGDELNALAQSKGVTLPTDPSITQRAKLKILNSETGTHFDKTYAKDIGVSAHKDTVALFQKEAANGKDPDVKAFAEKTLPTLQEHMKMATDLQAETAGKS
jgi:putative membrane protein